MANPLPGKALSDIEIEEMLARQALDRGMLHRLLPLLRPIRGAILTVIALEVVLVFTVFLRPLFVRELLDHGLVPQGDHWLLDERLVALLGLGLAASWLGCRSSSPAAPPSACSTTCGCACSPTSRH